jgi:NitT/TauT family transport system permease protein
VKRFLWSLLFFIALLFIWHLLVLAKIWSVVLLPDPLSVWEYLKTAAEDGTLLEASLVTPFDGLCHWFGGWLAAWAFDSPI